METNHVGFTMLTYFSSHLVITIRLEIMVVSKNCVITQYHFSFFRGEKGYGIVVGTYHEIPLETAGPINRSPNHILRRPLLCLLLC